ncbi:MAG: c-type cytochrome [Cyclobacteriaceae bacterium]|nr:c-type cytochrome [Cyclobacteriaceae bacterium]
MKRSIHNRPAFSKPALLIAALLCPIGVLAQTSASSGSQFVLYLLSGMVIVTLIAAIAIAIYVVRVVNMLTEQAARERAERQGVAYKSQPSLWKRLSQRLTRAAPIEREEEILLEHSYDGIRELDNHLPPWWKWLFYGTIIWGAGYLLVYHVMGLLPLSEEEYLADVERVHAMRATREVVEIDEATLVFTPDEEIISRGQAIFTSNCASCHRNDGGGGIGPNLTDDYWLHGGSLQNIFAVIKNGVPEKGMISWAPILKPEEIRDASFFVMSLRGSNVAGGKEPQGELYQEQPEPAQQDSVMAQIDH